MNANTRESSNVISTDDASRVGTEKPLSRGIPPLGSLGRNDKTSVGDANQTMSFRLTTRRASEQRKPFREGFLRSEASVEMTINGGLNER